MRELVPLLSQERLLVRRRCSPKTPATQGLDNSIRDIPRIERVGDVTVDPGFVRSQSRLGPNS